MGVVNKELAFTYHRIPGTGNVARLFCSSCSAHIDIHVGGHAPPEHTIKKFRSLGWEADIMTRRLCVCPACIETRALARKQPNGGLKTMSTAPATATAIGAATPPHLPAALTQHQRSAVRSLLDEYFDDSAGQYLSGYSDQRIGTECSVPWAAVTALRETAYGPIKSDVELDAVKALIVKAAEALADAQARMVVIEKRLGVRP